MRELSVKGERKASGSSSETGTELKNDMAGGGQGLERLFQLLLFLSMCGCDTPAIPPTLLALLQEASSRPCCPKLSG